MKLSEKECALLCGFMYLDQSVKNENEQTIGDILNTIKKWTV